MPVAPEQDRMANPYGMDPSCPRCDTLVETRRTIVHGYGDVAADFLFVAEAPTAKANRTGHPIVAESDGASLVDLFEAVGFLTDDVDDAGEPILDNAFVTHLTRCHHPERGPTDGEIANCEPFLNAEVRTINPEILVPVGERVLRFLAREFTTTDAAELSIDDVHATELRGRGFELIPLEEPSAMSEAQCEAAIDRIIDTLGRDYRQTKGRRSR